MADVFSLTTATAGGLDVLIRTGKYIYSRCEELARAGDIAAELRIFGVQSATQRLRTQFDVAKAIIQDPIVDSDLKNDLDTIFQDLQRALWDGKTQLDELDAAVADKMSFKVFSIRGRRKKAEKGVERINSDCGKFTNLLVLVGPQVTQQSPSYLHRYHFTVIGGIPARILSQDVLLCRGNLSVDAGRLQHGEADFVLEHRTYTAGTRATIERDVKVLSKSLSSTSRLQPLQGLLDFVGYNEEPSLQRFNLIFAMPYDSTSTSTLRNLLCNSATVPALNIRVELCMQLADAVLYVRSLDLVHKNISSANVAIMNAPSIGQTSHTLLYLLNWRLVRKASFVTQRAGETEWSKCIYLHPTWQAELAQAEYSMAHDIYSLGVVMLEILLWVAFVEEKEICDPQPKLSGVFIEHADKLGILEKNAEELARELDDSTVRPSNTILATYDSYAVQKILLDLAVTKLPPAVGKRLTDLVVSCLTCPEDSSDVDLRSGTCVQDGKDFMDIVKETLTSIHV